MDRQIARKHLQKLLFLCNAKSCIEGASEEVMNVCSNLFTPRRLTTNCKQIENVTFCGKAILKNDKQMGSCISYNKCIYKGTMYNAIKYSQGKKITIALLN